MNDLKAGGVQKRTLRLISGILKFSKAFNLTLIVNEKEGDLFESIHENVNLIILQNRSRTTSPIKQLHHIFRNKAPDIVVTCMGQDFIKAFFANTFVKKNIKFVIIQAVPVYLPGVTFVRNVVRKITTQFFYRFADEIICVSHDVRKSLSSLGKKAKVIYNPVVEDSIGSLSSKPVTHSFFNKQNKVLISVGRLHLQKDYPTLIKAFSIAKKKFTKSPLKLMILGEGEKRKVIEEEINRYSLENDVTLLGYVANPFPYVKKADLFVMSSLWEGLPSALIEALALGTQVVSTDCKAGPREILENGKFGSLVEVGDAEQLAEGILSELEIKRNEDLLLKRGSEFSVTESVRKYENLFLELSQ
ncbi:MAG: glycosyltransferase [Balneolaceae bacterium]